MIARSGRLAQKLISEGFISSNKGQKCRISQYTGSSSKKFTTRSRYSERGLSIIASSMRVVTIPILGDSKNYCYLLVDKSNKAAAVDPAEPRTVVEAAGKQGITIDAVLTTHKHWDHAGGNDEFKRLVPGVTVYGGKNDNCQGANKTVSDGDEFMYHDIHIKCLETPFHTMGHICYVCTAEGADDLVFTGDTLFVAGCGRFFEGKPEDAIAALAKLKKLPPKTQVWCGHNYTASNLRFALHAEPDNEAIVKKIAWTKEKDAQGAPTVPSSIEEELQINPFLRTDSPALQTFTGKSESVEVLAALRKAKDSF